MKKRINNKLNGYVFLFGLLILSTLFLAGCNHFSVKEQPSAERHSKMEKESGTLIGEGIKPITIENGSFYSINGWVDDDTIIYSTEVENGGNLYLYDLISGESLLLYESAEPIVSVKISPTRDRILIHSAPRTYEALITVINLKGQEILSKKIESYELAFEWNQFDENIILVASFTEDWDFDTFLLDVQSKSLKSASLEEPFAFWIKQNELLYLDWKDEQPSLLAPLVRTDLNGKKTSPIKTDIFMVDTIQDKILTITVAEEDSKHAIYSFYNNDFDLLQSIKLPVLSRFSDWLIPYQDYNLETETFYTFRPLHSGDADTYKEDFELYSFNMKTKEEQVLFKNLKNEPLSCSPNGMWCLYGNYFEKLLNIKEQLVQELVSDL